MLSFRFTVVATQVALLTIGWQAAVANAAVPEKIEFNAHIRPILSNKCFACHGFDPKTREADLRLDTFEGATAGESGTAAIVPGNLDASELWRRINSDDEDERMPPADSHRSLSADEIALLKAWIEQGAVYQKHWSFEPPVQHDPPVLTGVSFPIRNPIDAFVGQRLQQLGLTMSAEADRPTLIRRVAFALTGLPPTLAEIDTFLNDPAPDAYEKLVDRYLASPRYGEEMATHWLDVARYADTHGMHLDNERQMWAYRDWVIQAFNRNEPFDRFTIEQLAGDLLPNATNEQLVATGFNRCNVTSSEGGSIDDELIFRYSVDRASTTAEAWLGVTAGCAACHDHKFDPITQREFYSFYAFFHSAADPAMDGNALLTQPVVKLDRPDMRSKLQELSEEIASRQRELDEQAAKTAYDDPADAASTDQPTATNTLWLEDEFPIGANVQTAGPATTFVTASQENQVRSGIRSLKRTANGLGQDFYNSGAAPLTIPAEATLFAHVYLDPQHPPKAIMVQFHKGDWNRRVVWGDYNAIPFGTPNTVQKIDMGPLPATGEWVRLEFSAEKLQLAAGDRLDGFALTQFDGTVFWDQVGVQGKSSPATDPNRSFQAWWKQATGKDIPGVPASLSGIAKAGPGADTKPDDVQRLRTYYLQAICDQTRPQFAAAMANLARLRAEHTAIEQAIPSTFIYRDLPKPRDSFVMLRGAYDKPGEQVFPGVPAILPPLKQANPAGQATRLDLARWLVAPEQPLTARVTVNRFWQQVFGIGLVKTSFDFGSQGETPSHPMLLDWLAVDFQKHGWDVKRLIRQLVTSATFRQASRITPELYERDPDNRWYARGPRFRLSAEQIRDNALYVSGLINLEMGGRGVMTYQPPNIWEPLGFAGSNTQYYKQDSGAALYRRSIYVFLKRTAPPPFMANFDAPNREQFCTRRERSNTPLQALQLLNDTQHVEAARNLAQRILKEGGASAGERIAFAFRTVLARKPVDDEAAILDRQLAAHLARYQQDQEAARKLIAVGESKPAADLPPGELAAYTLLVNTILNLDETITRN